MNHLLKNTMNFKKIWIFLKLCFSKKERRKCGTVGSKTINVTLIASKDALLFLFFPLYSRTFHSLSSFQCCFLWHASKRIIATRHGSRFRAFPSPEINLGSCWTRITKRPRTFVLLLSFDNGGLLAVNERKSFLTLIYIREIRINDSPKNRATLSRIFTKRDESWRIFLNFFLF